MHTAQLNRVDVDAGWQNLVTGGDDKTVRVWNARNGHQRRCIRLPQGPERLGMVYAVAISPDGTLVAAGGCFAPEEGGVGERIYLLNPETGEVVDQIVGLAGMVSDLAFSPDGQKLVATLTGGAGMRLFDRDKKWGEAARDTDYGEESCNAAFATDGRFATTCWDGKVRLYRPQGKLWHTEPVGGKPVGLAFSPDNERLAVAFWEEERLLILDGSSLAEVGSAGYFESAFPTVVAWSADGARLDMGIYELPRAGTLIGIERWLGKSEQGR